MFLIEIRNQERHNVPAMVRQSGKAKEIAYKILKSPVNKKKKKKGK